MSLYMCVYVTSEHGLCPAGFHPVIPGMFKPLVYVWRPLMLWTQLVWRQQVGTAVIQGLVLSADMSHGGSLLAVCFLLQVCLPSLTYRAGAAGACVL